MLRHVGPSASLFYPCGVRYVNNNLRGLRQDGVTVEYLD